LKIFSKALVNAALTPTEFVLTLRQTHIGGEGTVEESGDIFPPVACRKVSRDRIAASARSRLAIRSKGREDFGRVNRRTFIASNLPFVA
jgi:hypothetical protein